MYVRNVSARLITINYKNGAPVSLPPGSKEAVKVQDSPFVASLIEREELIEVAAPKGEKAESVVTQDDPKAELQAQLKALGVDYDSRWGVDRLQKELDAQLNS